MAKKLFTLIMLLATVTVARAFDFSAQAPSGQTVFFDIYGTGVKVVNPDWDYYVKPTGTLVLPAQVENGGTVYNVFAVGQSAFEECTGLTHVVVPEGVTSIEGFAFYHCTMLDTIELPSTLTEILSQAFSQTGFASNAANRDSQGLLYIGQYLIGGSSLPDVVVADGTLGIAGMAFYNSHTLAKIEFPASLRFVGDLAFADCTALDTVRHLATVPPAAAAYSFQRCTEFTLAVPCGTAAAYSAAAVWNGYNIVEDCSEPVQGIDVADVVPIVARVDGGVALCGVAGHAVSVSDVMGRRVATVDNAADAQVVALPACGVYIINVQGLSPIKFFYCR